MQYKRTVGITLAALVSCIAKTIPLAAQSTETIDAARDSVAFLRVSYSGPGAEQCNTSIGSAFFVSDEGHALTAAHVLTRPEACPEAANREVFGRVGYSRTGEWIPVDTIPGYIDELNDVAIGTICRAERELPRNGGLPRFKTATGSSHWPRFS